MGRFCPKCGRSYSPKEVFIGNLCIDCYLEENPLFKTPERITVTICKTCGSVRSGSKWIETYSKDEILKLVEDKVRSETILGFDNVKLHVNLGILDFGLREVEVIGEASVGGVKRVQTKTLKLDVRAAHCPKCSRRLIGSYDAILQVRSSKGKLSSRELREIKEAIKLAGLKHRSNIVSVEEVEGGLDIKTLTRNTARELARVLRERFGAKILETYKRTGIDSSGRRVSKLTISVRIPFYKPGDIVLVYGRPASIEGFDRGKLHFRYLEEREIRSLEIERAWENAVKPLPPTSRIVEAVYAYKDDKNAHLIEFEEPENIYTLPLSSIPEYIRLGDVLKILLVNGKPYVLE